MILSIFFLSRYALSSEKLTPFLEQSIFFSFWFFMQTYIIYRTRKYSAYFWDESFFLHILKTHKTSKNFISIIINIPHLFCFRASINNPQPGQNNPYNDLKNARIIKEKAKVYKSRDDKEIARMKFANQTAQNVTFLLDHLLHQYDNSLRPDIRGKN